MTNLDYDVKLFTFFAVNGAGNGNVTIYILVLCQKEHPNQVRK